MTELTQQKFWKSFAKVSWEKKPSLVKRFDSPLSEIKEDQVFLMLVQYSNYCRKIKKAQGFKLYLDGQRQHEEDILQILPVKKDKSFLGYHQRMQDIFADYCLVCDELLQVSQESWSQLQQFTANLFAHVGFPNRFVEMGLYLGNYKKTPFGVHVDGCGVFSFPVVGEKTFRLWTPSYVKKNPALNRADHYARFKSGSKVLKASPGDMTYWPSSAWHIAESNGSFSATWSLGVWLDRSHQEVIEEALQPLLIQKLKAIGKTSVTPIYKAHKRDQAVSLPKNYRDSMALLQNITKKEMHDVFLKSWMKLSSKQGFKTIPAFLAPVNLAPVKINWRSQIQKAGEQGILWANLKSEPTTLYAFQGVLCETSHSPRLLNLIKDLNEGQRCRVSDYLTGSKKNLDLKVIQTLAKMGAII